MTQRSAFLGVSLDSVFDSTRTSVATVVSLLMARALKFPEFYWAPISTIVILQSTISPLQGAWQRFAGTALGAALGALIATFVGGNAAVYAGGVFICGMVAAMLRSWSTYRVAAIAMSIVVLIARERPAWIVASHRFLEVSLGIAVALLATLVWPRRQSRNDAPS